MKLKLRSHINIWIAFGVTAVHCQVSYANSMRAEDYFDLRPQIALAESAANGQAEKIKQILAEGVDINVQGRNGMTVLVWAILEQNKKGVQCLLEAGANPNIPITADNTSGSELRSGNSAISLAAMNEDSWYLKLILKHGGNPNLINPTTRETPVFQSIKLFDAKHPRIENMKLLIAAGADLNYRNPDGDTPLRIAADVNRYDLVYMLLEAGADPRLQNKWGKTILSPMMRGKTDPKSPLYEWRQKVVELLKAKGMDIRYGD